MFILFYRDLTDPQLGLDPEKGKQKLVENAFTFEGKKNCQNISNRLEDGC